MPIYEFLCDACQCQFEKLVFASDHDKPQCPTCCSTHVHKLISAGSFRPEGIATVALKRRLVSPAAEVSKD